MEPQKNPFIYGEALPPSKLIDREVEFARLLSTVRDGGRHFLLGPRRFGKTTLLNALVERANREGMPTCMLNAEAYLDNAALAGGIASEVARLFEKDVRSRLTSITSWFGRLKPQVEYDALTDSIKVSVHSVSASGEATNVVQALDTVDALAQQRNQRVCIIIDEFQELSLRGGIPAEKQLRAHVQQHHHLSYIFTGSEMSLMLALTNERRRPFYRLGDSQILGPLPREAFVDFARTEFAARDQHLTGEAYHRLFEACADVPYNLQRLCAEIWRGTVSEQVDIAEVDAALARALIDLEAPYRALWRTLTRSQRTVVAGYSRLPGGHRTVAATARGLGIADSTYRTARASLIEHEILRRDYASDGSDAYVLVDPFFGEWAATRITR